MIGSRIKELRINNKMTQLELANILNISDRAVSKWEQLKGNPDIELIPKIADLFGVSCDYLLTGKIDKSYSINIPESQDLFDYINQRIDPHSLTQKDAMILASLLQMHDVDFLKSCFLIALGQTVSKEPKDSEFVESLMTQIQRVAYARSRPLLVRKMGDLYYQYRNKKFDEYISKESFAKRMYYIFNKLNIQSDEERIKYIDATLLPLVLNVLTKQELNDELKKLLKNESAFDSNNTLMEDPVQDYSPIEKKIMFMEHVSPKTFLGILRNGSRVSNYELRLLDDIKRIYRFNNGVINVMIDYCFSFSKKRLTSSRMTTIASYLEPKNPKTVRETMRLLLEYHRAEETLS